MKPLTIVLALTFTVIFSSTSFAFEYDPLVEIDLICNQTMGKVYYSDGEVDNVKIDKKPTYVKSVDKTMGKGKQQKIKVNSTAYVYESGILYKEGEIARFNMLFVKDKPNLVRTETLTIAILAQNPPLTHMILTEPAMGNGRSFVRTSFYNCQFIK